MYKNLSSTEHLENIVYANCSSYGYGSRYNLYLTQTGTDIVQSYVNASEYSRVLRTYVGRPHFLPHLPEAPDGDLDTTLVVHLRAGDALGRSETWFSMQRNDTINYFQTCVQASGLKRVLIVTQLFSGPHMHPALPVLLAQKDVEVRGQPLSLHDKY